MAELILTAARIAREESQRLRAEGAGLRLAMRSQSPTAAERAAEAAEVAASLHARRAIPFESPWSGLQWLVEDESLERILLPVD